eukprot:TRINITY_DN12530_c0_g1_i1.p1 TRINITY_DN12530_c0_g1~~TRINITY_DN12530_c0_g1_i1.p1  ORF type:complete len:678 (+),score=167.94 TRINITY_DN12530_c0_g1_i1:61-2094(+)
MQDPNGARDVPYQSLPKRERDPFQTILQTVNKQELTDYTFGKTLGEGRYGKVKLATSVKTGQNFAVKILKKELISNPADIARIQRETQILTQLNHPNIIKLYDVIETRSHISIIMEFAQGGDLYQYVTNQSGGKLEMLEAIRVFRQMICGIRYCHQHLVVHRDLKLENIFLDSSKNVKIGDFGFSRSFSPGDALSTACGSLHYAAPEIISGKRYIGSEADVWSLGVIFYSILCGHLPFDAMTDSELAKKILRGQRASLNNVPQDGLREIIAGMLCVNPKERTTIPSIQRHPAIWLDKPLISSLVRPFATVLGANMNFLIPKANSSLRSTTDQANAIFNDHINHMSSKNLSMKEEAVPIDAKTGLPIRQRCFTVQYDMAPSSSCTGTKSVNQNITGSHFIEPNVPLISVPHKKTTSTSEAEFDQKTNTHTIKLSSTATGSRLKNEEGEPQEAVGGSSVITASPSSRSHTKKHSSSSSRASTRNRGYTVQYEGYDIVDESLSKSHRKHKSGKDKDKEKEKDKDKDKKEKRRGRANRLPGNLAMAEVGGSEITQTLQVQDADNADKKVSRSEISTRKDSRPRRSSRTTSSNLSGVVLASPSVNADDDKSARRHKSRHSDKRRSSRSSSRSSIRDADPKNSTLSTDTASSDHQSPTDEAAGQAEPNQLDKKARLERAMTMY